MQCVGWTKVKQHKTKWCLSPNASYCPFIFMENTQIRKNWCSAESCCAKTQGSSHSPVSLNLGCILKAPGELLKLTDNDRAPGNPPNQTLQGWDLTRWFLHATWLTTADISPLRTTSGFTRLGRPQPSACLPSFRGNGESTPSTDELLNMYVSLGLSY